MNKKRLSINLVANVFQVLSSLVISLYFTPYIVASLGTASYGFYAIAGSMISYFTVFTTALNSMANRFISISWHKEKYDEANMYYNTVLFSNIAISVVLSLFVIVFVAFLENFINISPDVVVLDVKMLFGLVLLSALLLSATSVFNCGTFCTNRLELKSGIMILNSIVRVAFLLAAFKLFKANIAFLGYATLIVTVIEVAFNFYFIKKLMSKLVFSIKYFNKKFVKILVSSGIWNSVNQLNTIMLNGLDVLMANLFITPGDAGILAISKSIPTIIWSLSAMMGGVFLPQFLIDYSKNNMDGLKNNFRISFNIMGFFASIVLTGFVVYGIDFYSLWLPDENSKIFYALSLLALLPLFFTGSTQVMGNVFVLTNKLKYPVVITTIRAFLGVVLVYFILKYASYEIGLYAIAGVSSIFSVLYDLFFDTPYAAKCIGFKSSFFYKFKIKFLAVLAVLSGVFFGIKLLIVPNSWMNLVISAAISGVLGILINFVLYLSKEQRKGVYNKTKAVLIKNK